MMSTLGHKRTSAHLLAMSALPPTADMCSAIADVRFGSKADICSAAAHVRFTPNSDRKSGHGRKLTYGREIPATQTDRRLSNTERLAVAAAHDQNAHGRRIWK